MQLSRYLRVYSCKENPGNSLIYSTRRGSLARISDPLLEAIHSGDLDTVTTEKLARIGILVPDPDAELEEARGLLSDVAARKGLFNITAVLNLDCNLACPYCFEGDFRRKQKMTDRTAGLLIERQILPQVERGRSIHIDFYGGEPLLTLQLLKGIAAPVADACRERGVGFTFDLFTNCTLLTRKVVEDLLPLGLRGVRMTLDGPREIHDRQRPFTSGRGSFGTIVANLKEIYDLVAVQITGNFGQDNWREFPRLLDHLLADGIRPEMLDLVQFSPIMPKSGDDAVPHHMGHCATGSEPWLLEAGPFLREETLRRGFPARKISMSACVVDFDNDLIVNWDGSFYKCPMFMGYPELSVGTLEDGMADYGVTHAIGSRWQTDECLECPYLPICFGGCRFLALQRGGSIRDLDCRRDYFDTLLESFVLQEQRYKSAIR